MLQMIEYVLDAIFSAIKTLIVLCVLFGALTLGLFIALVFALTSK